MNSMKMIIMTLPHFASDLALLFLQNTQDLRQHDGITGLRDYGIINRSPTFDRMGDTTGIINRSPILFNIIQYYSMPRFCQMRVFFLLRRLGPPITSTGNTQNTKVLASRMPCVFCADVGGADRTLAR